MASIGRDLVVKDASSSPAVTVAGVRTKSVTVNSEPVDITDDDSSGYRELLAEPGQDAVDLSVSGMTEDDTWRGKILTSPGSKTLESMEIEYPDGGTLTGSFYITSYAETGEYNGAVTFEMELQSSGSVTFSAASS